MEWAYFRPEPTRWTVEGFRGIRSGTTMEENDTWNRETCPFPALLSLKARSTHNLFNVPWMDHAYKRYFCLLRFLHILLFSGPLIILSIMFSYAHKATLNATTGSVVNRRKMFKQKVFYILCRHCIALTVRCFVWKVNFNVQTGRPLTNLPLTAANVQLVATNVRKAAANVQLAAANVPLTVANVQLAAANVQLVAENVQLAANVLL